MLQGFYTAASGMFMQQRVLNTISNNIANAQTPGYKSKMLTSSTFEQALLTRLENGRFTPIGDGDPVRIVSEVFNIFQTGGINETSRPFDMALSNSGFFNIEGEDGAVYLTRDGQFDLDDEGYLILRDRGRVLGQNGPLRLNTSNIDVSEAGVITNSLTGANLGRLRITLPAQEAALKEVRTGMYEVVEGAIAVVDLPGLLQGGLENSNVNMNDEMTSMIMAQRNFASASQALQMINDTYSKAVNIASL